MLTRILTGIIGIPIVIAAVLLGNPLFQYAVMFIALIGVYEFYHVLEKKYKPIKIVGYMATIIYFIFLEVLFKQYYAIFIALLIGILLIWMVANYPKYSIVDIAITMFAPIYVGLLMSLIVVIRDFQYGEFFVWLVFISAWGSDTCAYFTGKLLGKHKLAPVLSPKKTIEGSIGGAIGAALIAAAYTLIYTQFEYALMREKLWVIIIIVLIGAIVSQIGDLAASAIKRMLEEKDFGYIFPGHGGVLDRFDSILLVAPFVIGAILLTMGSLV